MPKVPAASSATARAADGFSGSAGTARDRGASESAVAAPPPVLTPEDFREIGATLNGGHWQSDIAKAIGCSKSQITRYLNNERTMSPLVARQLQFLIVERMMALAHVMGLPGMPHAGSDRLAQAQSEIAAALADLPGQEPPRDR